MGIKPGSIIRGELWCWRWLTIVNFQVIAGMPIAFVDGQTHIKRNWWVRIAKWNGHRFDWRMQGQGPDFDLGALVRCV